MAIKRTLKKKVYATAADYIDVQLTDMGPDRIGFTVYLRDGRIGTCTLTADEINALRFPEAVPPFERLEFGIV